MTDTSGTAGQRLDQAIAKARTALDGLRADLSEVTAEVGQKVNAKVDELQTAIDEIQAARAEQPPT